jgi:hypothetical protein
MTTPETSELELLLVDLESELVERKESLRSGNPPPEFGVQPVYFGVIVGPAP